MITLRPSAEQLQMRLDWLDSRHTFSFGEHHAARFMGFHVLRVINEDRVAPRQGVWPASASRHEAHHVQRH
jgi:redox-sensitive bicupin YhaK (pirin superfamily)